MRSISSVFILQSRRRRSCRVQSVSVGIVFATDEQLFVFEEFAGSGKHAVVGSYIESVLVVGLYGSHGMLLLTVQVHSNLVQIKVLEIEGIPLPIAVVSAIVDKADHDARGQVTGKQFLVTDVEIILRNREGLAHHATYRILCRAAFQCLGVSDEHGWHQMRTKIDASTICTLPTIAPIRQKSSLLRVNLIFTPTSLIM